MTPAQALAAELRKVSALLMKTSRPGTFTMGQASALDSVAARLDALGDGWRGIESAPKGDVLLYWPAFKPARGHEGNTLSARIDVGLAGGTPNRPPSHWMPLPEPPK